MYITRRRWHKRGIDELILPLRQLRVMPFQIIAFWNGVVLVKTTPLAFDLINATRFSLPLIQKFWRRVDLYWIEWGEYWSSSVLVLVVILLDKLMLKFKGGGFLKLSLPPYSVFGGKNYSIHLRKIPILTFHTAVFMKLINRLHHLGF